MSVRYSVRYWVEHFYRSRPSRQGWLNDKDEVLNFLQVCFVNWLEALSLRRVLLMVCI